MGEWKRRRSDSERIFADFLTIAANGNGKTAGSGITGARSSATCHANEHWQRGAGVFLNQVLNTELFSLTWYWWRFLREFSFLQLFPPRIPSNCTGFAQCWMVWPNQFPCHSQTLSATHLAGVILSRWFQCYPNIQQPRLNYVFKFGWTLFELLTNCRLQLLHLVI